MTLMKKQEKRSRNGTASKDEKHPRLLDRIYKDKSELTEDIIPLHDGCVREN